QTCALPIFGGHLGGGVEAVGEAVAQLGAELGELVAAPGVGGLAVDAVAAALFATQVGDADGAEGVEAVVALVEGEGRGNGQAGGRQAKEAERGHGKSL